MPDNRVLWLFEFPSLLGGERSLLAMLPGLRKANWQPEAIAPATGPLAEELCRLNVPLHPLTWRDEERQQRRDRRILLEDLSALLAKHPSHLVHANSLAVSRMVGPLTKELRRSSLGHIRDIVRLSQQAVHDLNCLDRTLAVSAATRDFHVAQGLEPERCHVLYNGVDLSKFTPRPPSGWLHRELSLPAETRLVGTIGQLVLRKGHDTLVAAARQLAAKHPNAHFVFVGDCPSQKAESLAHARALRAAFESGEIAGCGHFLGVRGDIHLLLPELSMLVHPARQEPLGRVLLEAAAAGCAIVATDVGGTREIFSKPGAAILIPPDDPVALAQAIGSLLTDEPARIKLSIVARQLAEEKFGLESASAGLIRHYAEIAD